MTGTVYLVGAGPGAPDLLTLRAVRLLEKADIVFHDALVPSEILALAGQAKHVSVGKRCGRHSSAQRFINKRLIDAAGQYAVVVRLKGGDPLLFGRAQEEIAALEGADIAYEIVPGVSAAMAAAAAVGTSLSQRGSVRSVAFATPRIGSGENASDWVQGFSAADAGAIYMGIGEAAEIAAKLIARGKPRSLPVAIVENASLPNQRIVHATLAKLLDADVRTFVGPTLLLVGPQFASRVTRAAKAEERPPRPAVARKKA
jgi:uroporphyrin-III C-methyltransferase